MAKKISIGTTVAITLLGCLVTFQATYITLHNRYEEKYASDTIQSVGSSLNQSGLPSDPSADESSSFMNRVVQKLSEVDFLYRNYYIGDMDEEQLLDMIVTGYVAGTGDDYAAYYNAEDFQAFQNDQQGEMAGVGINVIYNTDYGAIEVINVMPDSPALEAGIQVGDLIIAVGEEKESVASLGYYPAIAKLQGEVGTEAIFTVARGDQYSEQVDFRITRAKVTEQSVLHHVYEPDASIGVIKITSFNAKTPEQFVAAVEELTGTLGCEKLIIDLRYNPGGELSSIVTVLDYLVPKGPIIRIFDASGELVDQYNSESTELNVPMAVLVNGSTASAAELFTSAVRDYDKAVIVGTTTYGKGCMQTTVPLSNGGAVTITYRMYSPPFSDNYHGVGIIPDIVVELDEALADKNIYKITDWEDNQMAAAAAALNK